MRSLSILTAFAVGATLLTKEILAAVMDSMEAQAELSTRALNSAEIREGLKLVLLNQLGLYEKLEARSDAA